MSTSIDRARKAAVKQLHRAEQAHQYVNLLDLGEDAEGAESSRLREYISGVTRWKRYLDFLIDHFYKGKAHKLHPLLRQILRLGTYELLFTRTPPPVVISQAVELARALVRPQVAGLVNAVLRAINRARDQLPQPQTGNLAEDLAIQYSYPTWLVERWLNRWGQETTERMLSYHNERPVYGLRINTLRVPVEQVHTMLDTLGVSWEPSPYIPYMVRVRQLRPIIRAGWLDKGWVAVQDESAGLVVRALDPQAGETLVDACSAPGGKALHAAQLMHDKGRILAYDLHPERVALVDKAANVQGVQSIQTRATDVRTLSLPEPVDKVLLDVPCTGLGVLGKRADLRWQRKPEDIQELAHLQDELLDAAASWVRPRGVLVYSTCTVEPEENEERIEAFLARHPEFHRESLAGRIPEEVLHAEGYMQTLPHKHTIDGAFAARLRKKD